VNVPSVVEKRFSFFSSFSRLLDQYQSRLHPASIPDTEAAIADCTVADMEQEIQSLERKLFLEEIAVNITDERCSFLDRNFRWACEEAYFNEQLFTEVDVNSTG